MSEMGEDFAAWNKIKQAKRASNRNESADYLLANGIEFTSHNAGAHLIVYGKGAELIDFWPGTGLWRPRNGLSSRGVRRLVEYIRK